MGNRINGQSAAGSEFSLNFYAVNSPTVLLRGTHILNKALSHSTEGKVMAIETHTIQTGKEK